MLTINIDGKTYVEFDHDRCPGYVRSSIEIMIASVLLIESEENTSRTFTIWFDEYEAIKKDSVKLEKIIEKLKLHMNNTKDSDKSAFVLYQDILWFIDSLETSEDRELQK